MARTERIQSGEWQRNPEMEDYRAEWLTDVLVERAAWRVGIDHRQVSHELGEVDSARAGYVWVRFWFRREDQIVEKYFTDRGHPLGFLVPVCMPLEQQGARMAAQPLGLALWIEPAGRVTVLGEPAFEAAAQQGAITPVALEQAEQRIRELTMLTAQRRFPPAFARNFAIVFEDSP
jgi:predicted RNA-binding protein associated with RNAse of E/G family